MKQKKSEANDNDKQQNQEAKEEIDNKKIAEIMQEYLDKSKNCDLTNKIMNKLFEDHYKQFMKFIN